MMRINGSFGGASSSTPSLPEENERDTVGEEDNTAATKIGTVGKKGGECSSLLVDYPSFLNAIMSAYSPDRRRSSGEAAPNLHVPDDNMHNYDSNATDTKKHLTLEEQALALVPVLGVDNLQWAKHVCDEILVEWLDDEDSELLRDATTASTEIQICCVATICCLERTLPVSVQVVLIALLYNSTMTVHLTELDTLRVFFLMERHSQIRSAVIKEYFSDVVSISGCSSDKLLERVPRQLLQDLLYQRFKNNKNAFLLSPEEKNNKNEEEKDILAMIIREATKNNTPILPSSSEPLALVDVTPTSPHDQSPINDHHHRRVCSAATTSYVSSLWSVSTTSTTTTDDDVLEEQQQHPKRQRVDPPHPCDANPCAKRPSPRAAIVPISWGK